MDRDDILNVFREFAQSQGFYGRLLRDLAELEEYEPDAYEEFMQNLKAQDFRTPLDVILYIET